MAILKNGPNGGFSGRVGSVVGYQWRGKDVIRGLPRFTSKKRSPAQLANQLKMKLTQQFLKSCITFIRDGFKHEAEQRVMSAFNVAMSYNKKQAITGEYPNLVFDYSKALVSMGRVPAMKDGTAVWTDAGLKLEWSNDTGKDGASRNDNLWVLLFFPEYETCEVCFNGASRDKGEAIVTLRPYYLGKPVHIYTSFVRYNGSDISPSIYIGSLT